MKPVKKNTILYALTASTSFREFNSKIAVFKSGTFQAIFVLISFLSVSFTSTVPLSMKSWSGFGVEMKRLYNSCSVAETLRKETGNAEESKLRSTFATRDSCMHLSGRKCRGKPESRCESGSSSSHRRFGELGMRKKRNQ